MSYSTVCELAHPIKLKGKCCKVNIFLPAPVFSLTLAGNRTPRHRTYEYLAMYARSWRTGTYY